ncbi:uncharacterized protein LOC120643841 [Panicum virgatum]|uniref:uncharacterized protein LOC120643841 n=1 Tax=Panicum virgatum TaxID=38727 RepID=UPI0019D51CC5|nr:uncharacterized protein LOC120643841 [Panicum virgatum]
MYACTSLLLFLRTPSTPLTSSLSASLSLSASQFSSSRSSIPPKQHNNEEHASPPSSLDLSLLPFFSSSSHGSSLSLIFFCSFFIHRSQEQVASLGQQANTSSCNSSRHFAALSLSGRPCRKQSRAPCSLLAAARSRHAFPCRRPPPSCIADRLLRLSSVQSEATSSTNSTADADASHKSEELPGRKLQRRCANHDDDDHRELEDAQAAGADPLNRKRSASLSASPRRPRLHRRPTL